MTKRTPNPCKASSGMTKTSLGIPSCIFLPWSLPNPENHWTSSTSPLRVPETKGHVSVTFESFHHALCIYLYPVCRSLSAASGESKTLLGTMEPKRVIAGAQRISTCFFTPKPHRIGQRALGRAAGEFQELPRKSPPQELATREVLPTFERKPTEKNSSVSIRFDHLSEVNRPQMIPTSEVSTNSPAGLHSSRNPHLAQRSPVIFHDAEAEEL